MSSYFSILRIPALLARSNPETFWTQQAVMSPTELNELVIIHPCHSQKEKHYTAKISHTHMH